MRLKFNFFSTLSVFPAASPLRRVGPHDRGVGDNELNAGVRAVDLGNLGLCVEHDAANKGEEGGEVGREGVAHGSEDNVEAGDWDDFDRDVDDGEVAQDKVEVGDVEVPRRHGRGSDQRPGGQSTGLGVCCWRQAKFAIP